MSLPVHSLVLVAALTAAVANQGGYYRSRGAVLAAATGLVVLGALLGVPASPEPRSP